MGAKEVLAVEDRFCMDLWVGLELRLVLGTQQRGSVSFVAQEFSLVQPTMGTAQYTAEVFGKRASGAGFTFINLPNDEAQ